MDTMIISWEEKREEWEVPTIIDQVLFGPLAEPGPPQTPTQPKPKTTHTSKLHHPLNPTNLTWQV